MLVDPHALTVTFPLQGDSNVPVAIGAGAGGFGSVWSSDVEKGSIQRWSSTYLLERSIIVTDPPPPIESSGASVISSREYYQAGDDHLVPGGIMTTPMVKPWSSSGTKLLGTNRNVIAPKISSTTKPASHQRWWRMLNPTARR